MATEVSICNKALAFLGASPIISLNDDNEAGRLCKAVYADQRDALLQGYPWNFAMRRASLAAEVTAPLWGFACQYILPAGPDPEFCLRVYQVEDELDNACPYKIEGRKILTDDGGPLNIIYIARVTDPGLYSPLFSETLSATLAVILAANLTESPGRIQAAQAWLDRASTMAEMSDAQEGTPDDLNPDVWLRSRL